MSHVTHLTTHITHHTSHITHHTSHITRHTLQVVLQFLRFIEGGLLPLAGFLFHEVSSVRPCAACHMSHVTRHTSHVTRHTSHVTHPPSHSDPHTSPFTGATLHHTHIYGAAAGRPRFGHIKIITAFCFPRAAAMRGRVHVQVRV